MFAAHFFLGFHVDFRFSENLARVNPEILRIFIQKEGNYLIEVTYRRKKYLGKYIEGVTDYNQLELLEEHIYSLLKKISPQYPFREYPLYLFPLPG